MAINILIADDSRMMRQLLKKSLTIIGCETNHIQEAADGKEALQLLREHWIDLILLDINMPRLTGIEFLKLMRKNELWDATPVVVVSTESSFSRRHELELLGVQGYLPKPFHPEELRRLLAPIFEHQFKAQAEELA